MLIWRRVIWCVRFGETWVSALMMGPSSFSETASDIRRPKYTDRFVG